MDKLCYALYGSQPETATQKVHMGDEDREAIKLVCFPQKDLAAALGVSYSTLRNWSSGRIEIPAENSVALARFMRTHAKNLSAAADELEG